MQKAPVAQVPGQLYSNVEIEMINTSKIHVFYVCVVIGLEKMFVLGMILQTYNYSQYIYNTIKCGKHTSFSV